MRPVKVLVEKLRPYRITKDNDQGIKNVPEQLASNDTFMGAGAFVVPRKVNGVTKKLFVIADDSRLSESGWEHVSAHVYRGIDRKGDTPTWDDMHHLKKLFWSSDETVVQYHPPEKHYVNNHEHTLHLWKAVNEEFPVPPEAFV